MEAKRGMRSKDAQWIAVKNNKERKKKKREKRRKKKKKKKKKKINSERFLT